MTTTMTHLLHPATIHPTAPASDVNTMTTTTTTSLTGDLLSHLRSVVAQERTIPPDVPLSYFVCVGLLVFNYWCHAVRT